MARASLQVRPKLDEGVRRRACQQPGRLGRRGIARDPLDQGVNPHGARPQFVGSVLHFDEAQTVKGSQRIIDRMDRRVSLETVQTTMQQTRALGMEAGTFIMVGYPGEELEDIQQTMEHIKACNPHLLTITKAYPIKGTGLYTEIEETITTNLDWQTSTDRDIRFSLPYSDKFYDYSIRYLVNGWLAHRDQSRKHRLKSRAALALMKWNK